MTIRRLKPVPQRPATPQCSQVVDRSWYATERAKQAMDAKLRAKGYDVACCIRSASVVIDGKPYCNIHGGLVAIDILIEQQRAAK
jgi:hypothetical protein